MKNLSLVRKKKMRDDTFTIILVCILIFSLACAVAKAFDDTPNPQGDISKETLDTPRAAGVSKINFIDTPRAPGVLLS